MSAMDRSDLVKQLSQEMALEQPKANENHYISATGTLLTDTERFEQEQRERLKKLEEEKAKKADPWEKLAGSLNFL